MRILVTGSSGLVGSALVPSLTAAGHQVERLVRKANAGAGEVRWNPDAGQIDRERLEDLDAVFHLAGESIASGRWTKAKKERIRDSRVQATRLLSAALAERQRPPQTLVCASAIGFYGDRGDEWLDESSPPGRGFLADVCREWEAAADPARQKGIRVVHTRIGVVLSAAGGALAVMLTPFKLGVGGVVGSGRQFMSWIALDELIAAFHHVLNHGALHGPVNCTAPNPVTNREFTKTLGRVLGRPTCFPLPAFAARLALGEMADELLLSSTRVTPRRLQDSGYQFQFPDLEGALRHVLGKRPG
jgi:uncharacterized protein (TIGR01777 family)